MMNQAKNRKQWVYAGGRAGNKPPDADKRAITAACETFIDEILKPRFLPEIVPTEYNYPIDIYGRWLGNKYRFIQRYRCGHPDSTVPEFDAPFARLEYVSRDRFDVSYFRHTQTWHCLYQFIPLAEALKHIEENVLLQPV